MIKIDWKNDYQEEFICPECQKGHLRLEGFAYGRKRRFICKNCFITQPESLEITQTNISRFSHQTPTVEKIVFSRDKWDLRDINPNFNLGDIKFANVNFSKIKSEWFKQICKKYIEHLCKINTRFGTIQSHLLGLRFFARYLEKNQVSDFSEINRTLILGYITDNQKGLKNKLSSLRKFFAVGSIKGWFNISQDIIKNEDFPKNYLGNPEPLSDFVREQIEQNLHKLPDPIARMWIVCFFAAMRPSELCLLKKDCLIQEGQYWKLRWKRDKTEDYHEVPITRIIAKVVQEQLEYINNLWGNDWDYLFCHYRGLSATELTHPKLEPVRRVLPTHSRNPFIVAIRYLIQSESICDENGKLAEFSPKKLRTTRLTQLFEQGHDLAVISAWAGHKSFATTSTYYTQVSCELIEKETAHIQRALVNSEGHQVLYESMPKSFWKNPTAHELRLSETHVNTPIYGYCGLPLNEYCEKFRACYTCSCFVAKPEKLPLYIQQRDELRRKEAEALANGHDVALEQLSRQADQLDKIIEGLQEVA